MTLGHSPHHLKCVRHAYIVSPEPAENSGIVLNALFFRELLTIESLEHGKRYRPYHNESDYTHHSKHARAYGEQKTVSQYGYGMCMNVQMYMCVQGGDGDGWVGLGSGLGFSMSLAGLQTAAASAAGTAAASHTHRSAKMGLPCG